MRLRDHVMGWLLTAFMIILSLTILLFGTGCAHEQARPAPIPPAALPVVNAVDSARVKAARLELSVPPENRRAVADLSATLDSASTSLAIYSRQVDAQTLSLAVAETQITDQSAKISKLGRDLHQTAKERDFYPILFAVAAAIVALRVFGESASRLPFGAGLFGPFIILAAGGAAGFILSRTIAAYGSRFIP